ncbi:MAG: DUF4360 domain-containing protein [Bauldia sp.]|nr:DUF4360 domain-containing protein [Bauldia sp.]
MKRLVLLAFAVAAATSAHAQTFGEPTLGGTACRSGTTATITGTALNPLVVIDGFVAETTAASPMARATCTLAIPVDVPDGWSIAVVGAGYRLDASIAGGTTATVSVEAFLAGQQAPPLTRAIAGPLSGPFVGASVVSPADRQWSACGGAGIVRLNASVLLTGDAPAASTVTVGQLRIKLAARPC